jgi:hypothetical protein
MFHRSSAWEFVVATAGALFIGIVLSLGAVYGLNRYLGPDEQTAESAGFPQNR